MEYAISLNSILPIRAEASEKSEMVTQLLFGEYCTIIEEATSFVKIKNQRDNYIGWTDKRMLNEVTQETFEQLVSQPLFMVNMPIANVFCMTNKSIYHLSAGSLLPFYDPQKSSIEINGITFQIHPTFVTYLPHSTKENIILTAKLFLNTPYLWGGKNILGIDCSGFTQVVYSLNGYNIPRDASLQAKAGYSIPSLDEAQTTDLLFFEKENKITHVGIYLGENKIIHASGKVRIDKINEKGIYNEDLSAYTHDLSSIKRM